MRSIIALPLLALSALGAGPALAQTVPMLPDGTILEVSATGKTTRVPDIATISAGVVTQSQTAAQALSGNAEQMAKVLAALKAAGVQPRDIATSSVSLQPQYRYENNQPPVITGYQASNNVSIRFRDVTKAGKILDTLVAQGANQINGPNLSIDQPDAALDEARADAVKRARARADLYAKAAGLSVSRILSISENGEQAGEPRPPIAYMARAKAAPAADTEIAPGEADVTVTIAVRFLLK
jgi:hypothetical protein